MSEKVKFILLGGFLGAGKTTAIARIANMYINRGLKVGIITNDQAEDLVDTQALREKGFEVGQVPGACFCCSFDQLANVAETLTKEAQPQIILAEPVGSCTDVVATVVRPITEMLNSQYEVASYGVILKPEFASSIAAGQITLETHKELYIFIKQIEEADFLIINKIDILDNDEIQRLTNMVSTINSSAFIIKVSSLTGDGFDKLIDFIDSSGGIATKSLDVDYELYAEAESNLGWLNARVRVARDGGFPLEEVVQSTVEAVRQEAVSNIASIAHVKVSGRSGAQFAVANTVNNNSPASVSIPSKAFVESVELTINARIAIDPATLETIVQRALDKISARFDLNREVIIVRSFRPGRPVPTHRIPLNARQSG